MNQKASERPTLQGQRIKTRKRDEKEKYDPQGFRDSIISGIRDTNDLEGLSRFLDFSGSKLDYRRYGEALFDILIAGGLLAPGGSLILESASEVPPSTDVSVFGRPGDDESVRAFSQVFVKLIRRYKYLEKLLEEDLNKIIVFLRAFSEENRLKLAKIFALLLASGHINVTPLKTLLEQEVLIKEGLAIQFLVDLFKIWQLEKDASTVWTSLRKSNLDSKLLDFLPKTNRSQNAFSEWMLNNGLGQLLDYQKAQRVETLKKGLSSEIANQIQNENATVDDLQTVVRDYMQKCTFSESDVVVILWNSLMALEQWSKKEELVADQAVKYLKTYIPLFSKFCTSHRTELALLVRVQEYCYENMNFLKAFQKIVLQFYKNDILSEDVILRWYKKDHSSKGKSIFLEQMSKFIHWLNNAEEEGSDDE